MSGWQRGPGRRGLRDEVQATWFVFDALRPITKYDLVDPDLAEPSPPVAAPPSRSEPSHAPDEGTRTVTLTSPADVCRFDAIEQTDAQLAAMLGLAEMDVREGQEWTREQTEGVGAGTVTVTGIDRADGIITLARQGGRR